MDYLELFNRLIDVARPVNAVKAQATSLDQNLKDTGLDSLDLLMVGIFLSDIYGVDEATAKAGKYDTVGDMVKYFESCATKHPKTVAEAMEAVK